MMTPLQEFLFALKTEGLEKERRATGVAKTALTMQLQVFDVMLQFLASQQKETDMGKLRLTLADHATPANDIKRGRQDGEFSTALIELAAELEAAWQEELKRAKREGRKPEDLKIPLDNIGNRKPTSVSVKIYTLRTAKKLPENIVPAIRTSNVVETVKDERTGKEKDVVVRKEEHLFMKWTQNPPPLKGK